MTFLYPLGFCILALIPIPILVYIIKNRYTEQTIPSTYIWTQSEKFIKRRTPINKLVGIIGLLLQILVIAAVAFAVADPVRVKRGAAQDYCFILDASGSMTTLEGDKTRFTLAKEQIEEIIASSADGSAYTLVYAGSAVEVKENIADKERALYFLNHFAAGYSSQPLTEALETAQALFSENPSLKVYLFTDGVYGESENITVVTIGGERENYALSGVHYAVNGDKMDISGKAVSYVSDASVTVELYIDDNEEPAASQTLSLAGGEEQGFAFSVNAVAFKQFRVAILESDVQPADNEVIVYNLVYEEATNTLIVSDKPSTFLKAALTSAGLKDVETVALSDYAGKRGYGLYIFEGVLPDKLPDDGAVWFINPQASLTGTNFSYQGTAEAMENAGYSANSSTMVRGLLEGVTPREFAIKQYVKCGLSGRFYTLISCENNPLVFAGTNAFGRREAVFAFDLRDATAFTLSDSFTVLVYNLLGYSFPTVIEQSNFYCGDTVQIYISGAENVKIQTPLGGEFYPAASGDLCEYRLDEVGVYTVTLEMKDGLNRVYNLYSSLPEEERKTSTEENSFSLLGTATPPKRASISDKVLIVLILLLVLAVADYGVYCYEQYQLR